MAQDSPDESVALDLTQSGKPVALRFATHRKTSPLHECNERIEPARGPPKSPRGAFVDKSKLDRADAFLLVGTRLRALQ
jgi:hypothetical protein